MGTAPVINAVIQARSSSARLPGKVLRQLGDRSVLGWVIRAAALADGIDRVVVATSDQPDDDPVAHEASTHGADVVRGPLADVLARFLLATERFPAEAVVRLTADCPLLDPALLAQLAALWRRQPTLDYVSTTLVRTLPRGFDAELVRTDALAEQARQPHGPHREHVTWGVKRDPDRYACEGIVVAPSADDLRVTLDTDADWELLAGIVAALGNGPYGWRDVVTLLRARPDLAALNADVEQKEVRP